MNTRFAAIAGTLLVGLSLFVTTLITNNLNNSTLSTSSLAAGRSGTCKAFATCEKCAPTCTGSQCTKKITQVGCKYIDENGQEVIVPVPSDMPLPTQQYTGDGNPYACIQPNSCSVYAARLTSKFQNWCEGFCNGTRRAPQNTSTPSPTQSATQPYCTSTVPAGARCDGLGVCCASGSFCIDLGAPGKYCLGISPTPGAFQCLNGSFKGSKYGCNNPNVPGGNPCCAPRVCKVSAEYPGPPKSYDIDCVLPTLTPTPSPTPRVGSCFDSCSGNTPGQCVEGSCRSLGDPSNPNPDCRTKGDCKCIRNDTCKDDKSKDCLCFDPQSCPNLDEGDFDLCGCWRRDATGKCLNPAGECKAPLECSEKVGVGYCTSKYCVTPTPTPDSPWFKNPVDSERSQEVRIERILRANPNVTRQQLESLPNQYRRNLGLD
jgi:hypothetical protein